MIKNNNFVMYDPKQQHFNIRGVRRSETGDTYSIIGKKVSPSGHLHKQWVDSFAASESDAILRCKAIVKMKVRKHKFVVVPVTELPDPVLKFPEFPLDMQVTPEEMVRIIMDARRERYVTLGNVYGIEEFFDAGIPYIAYVTDDPEILKVYDKFGVLRDVL